MNRLHLVGFTTDLKSLVFARRKGSKTGSFIVPIDDRLRRTLAEVDKLEDETDVGDGPAPVQASRLTPKEIQSLLREGKSAEDVAKLAEKDVSWIQRFTGPIIAEKMGVIDAVRTATISKPRLGPSALPVGEAVEVNLMEKRAQVPREIIDDSWNATRRGDEWEVTFRYVSRSRVRLATFRFHPDGRTVEATNSVAGDIAWRSPDAPDAEEVAARSSGRRKSSSRKQGSRAGSRRSPAPKRKKSKGGSRKGSAGKRATSRAPRKAAPGGTKSKPQKSARKRKSPGGSKSRRSKR